MKSYLHTRRLLAGPLLTGLAAVYTAKAEDIRHPNDLMKVG